jgi:branched-chain amino acid transport system permease protein
VYYVVTLVVALAAFGIVRAVFRAEIGAILTCINEDEEFSRSLGVNALRWRTAVFGLSAALAAVSGSLYAYHLNFLSPAAFTFMRSVDALVMNFVGGVSSALGPVVGALLIVPLPELLREAKEYQLLAYGAILLACLLFFKDGILGYFTRPRRPVMRPKRAVA